VSADFTVYQATNPATPPDVLGQMAASRPDLRQFVAANPATPQSVVDWLATLGDHAVDAALARRRPPAGVQPPPPTGPAWSAPAGQAPQQRHHQPPAPYQGPAQPYQAPAQPYAGGTNPYGPPAPAGPYGYPAPVSGTPQDAYSYGLPPPRRRTGLIVAIVVAAVLLLGGLAFAATSILGVITDDAGYGEDPALDRLWDACADGDAEACDSLYWESPVGSEYERFGDTCGDRFPEGHGRWCVRVM